MESVWTDETSVLFTSLWGWSPETWGTIGWTGNRGRSRRANLLRQVTNPFITVCYVTSTSPRSTDPDLKGAIAGYYVVSHEVGDRDEFTHPFHHTLSPEKWRHSLRALSAFSYLPEYRLRVPDLDPTLLSRAQTVAAMGELLTDPRRIALLRETPHVEVDVYAPTAQVLISQETKPLVGKVRAGPASKGPYVVSSIPWELPRRLYVLKLHGDTNAYLGRPSGGRSIYKIGLAESPELRRQVFQNAMPQGSFCWHIEQTSNDADCEAFSFAAAVAGEDAMKRYLATSSEWLGGEFYLASEADIDEAWRLGCSAAGSRSN